MIGNKEIGSRLRSKRKHKKYTLEHVNRVTGISISFLSDIERGKASPSIKTLFKLCDIYGVQASEILRENNKLIITHDDGSQVEVIPSKLWTPEEE